MHFPTQALLDTTPRWLSLTLVSSSAALLVSGVGLFFSQTASTTISPFTLMLHLVWAIALSAWVLNLRMKLNPEKKALLALGVAVTVGSTWSSVQQWLAYVETGVVNDIILVAASTVMDLAGGAVSYILFHLNILKK
ncbi:MAG TPA: hypothetical protein VI816_01990 [Candidatus Bathyarchaeia archaeon]|nr:hypothetical protein [Candidatus Bathyarchaeia archaeon]